MFKNETLVKKIAEYAKMKDEMDRLKFKIDAMKEEFRQDMAERGLDVYEFECNNEKHKVSYKTFDKVNIDSKMLKEKFSEAYEACKKVVPQSRLTVK